MPKIERTEREFFNLFNLSFYHQEYTSLSEECKSSKWAMNEVRVKKKNMGRTKAR